MTSRMQLSHWDLDGKRVIVRIDGNVPLIDGHISNDYRLQRVMPTLQYIKRNGGTIVLITHIGRPKKPSAALSTRILMPWFKAQGFSVAYAADIESAYAVSMQQAHDIVLLENIRFFAQEQEPSRAFATQLATLGDLYVNDAFATLHRHDTSVTLLAQAFAQKKRSIGFLVQQELEHLNRLIDNPQRPFLLFLGGGKPEGKIQAVAALIGKVDTIVLCPALVFTFACAAGNSVGKSLVDTALIETARSIMEQVKLQQKTKLIFPSDYSIAYDTLHGALYTVPANDFPANGVGISIGPATLKALEPSIMQAGTIFFNCAMGFPAQPETLEGSRMLMQAIASTNAYTVIAGGNSVELAYTFNLETAYDFLSTGGGATLAYIAGQPLPGLCALQ